MTALNAQQRGLGFTWKVQMAPEGFGIRCVITHTDYYILQY